MSRRALATEVEAPTTRDVILDAAEQRFAERGFDGVSMREIAADAGLRNQASLYHHFRDKRDLYEAVLGRGLGPVVALVAETSRAVAGAADPSAGPGDAIERMIDYLADHPHLPRLIQRAALDDSHSLRSSLTRLLGPLYAEGLQILSGTVGRWEPSELPHVALGLYNLIFGYFANAALMEVVIGLDARSPVAVARQRRFLKTAVAQLLETAPVRRVVRSGLRRN